LDTNVKRSDGRTYTFLSKSFQARGTELYPMRRVGNLVDTRMVGPRNVFRNSTVVLKLSGIAEPWFDLLNSWKAKNQDLVDSLRAGASRDLTGLEGSS
jgi:hypothetical protein